MTILSYLPERGVIEISGPDRVAFLQGLVSNDVTQVAPGRAVWSALLTPQGRYLAEFFIFSDGTSLFLDAPLAAIPDIMMRLSRFRLRSKISLCDQSSRFAVHAGWGGDPETASLMTAPDMRTPHAGFRMLAGKQAAGAVNAEAYIAHRLALGLPDHADLEPDKTLLMEAGFDELHGIDWGKGCFMGQELTARTRFRGLVKRRLLPVDGNEDLLSGSKIMAGARQAGDLRTCHGRRGLAMLRLDCLGEELRMGQVVVHPRIPDWLTVIHDPPDATL